MSKAYSYHHAPARLTLCFVNDVLCGSEAKAKEDYSQLLDLEARAHASIKTADAMLVNMLEKVRPL